MSHAANSKASYHRNKQAISQRRKARRREQQRQVRSDAALNDRIEHESLEWIERMDREYRGKRR